MYVTRLPTRAWHLRMRTRARTGCCCCCCNCRGTVGCGWLAGWAPQPEGFAQLTCQDNELPAAFVNLITTAMELQLGEYNALKDVDVTGRLLTIKLDVRGLAA